MATMTASAMTKDAIRERVGPTLEALEENVRQARRAVIAGRHAAEDFATGAALQVRRHPMSAVAVVAGAGAALGCLIGFALGWRLHRRTSA